MDLTEKYYPGSRKILYSSIIKIPTMSCNKMGKKFEQTLHKEDTQVAKKQKNKKKVFNIIRNEREAF